jgi:hypothetical protein
MPHPKSLLDSIRRELERDYPPSQFAYFEEQTLKEISGPRMMPDFAVRDGESQELVCLVEIGYTRPEKLQAYRRLGISDVRWYSKAGQLITDHEYTVITRQYVPPVQEKFFHFFCVERDVPYCQCRDEILPWLLEEGLSTEEAELSLYEDSDNWTVHISHAWIGHQHFVMLQYCDECGEGCGNNNSELIAGFYDLDLFLQESFDFQIEIPIDLEKLERLSVKTRRKVDPVDWAVACLDGLFLIPHQKTLFDPPEDCGWSMNVEIPPTNCTFDAIQRWVKTFRGIDRLKASPLEQQITLSR